MTKRLYKGTCTVKDKICQRVNRSKANVFIPKDFKDISSMPQILRALKQLVEENVLIKFSYGAYAKTKYNTLTEKYRPNIDDLDATKELLSKLKIKWDYSQEVKDYNANLSTQIPVNKLIVVRGRFSRKLGQKRINQIYENA